MLFYCFLVLAIVAILFGGAELIIQFGRKREIIEFGPVIQEMPSKVFFLFLPCLPFCLTELN